MFKYLEWFTVIAGLVYISLQSYSKIVIAILILSMIIILLQGKDKRYNTTAFTLFFIMQGIRSVASVVFNVSSKQQLYILLVGYILTGNCVIVENVVRSQSECKKVNKSIVNLERRLEYLFSYIKTLTVQTLNVTLSMVGVIIGIYYELRDVLNIVKAVGIILAGVVIPVALLIYCKQFINVEIRDIENTIL